METWIKYCVCVCVDALTGMHTYVFVWSRSSSTAFASTLYTNLQQSGSRRFPWKIPHMPTMKKTTVMETKFMAYQSSNSTFLHFPRWSCRCSTGQWIKVCVFSPQPPNNVNSIISKFQYFFEKMYSHWSYIESGRSRSVVSQLSVKENVRNVRE